MKFLICLSSFFFEYFLSSSEPKEEIDELTSLIVNVNLPKQDDILTGKKTFEDQN